jgi:hypothetical protein
MKPDEGEACGLQQAIMWMKMLGYYKMIFEMDCKMIVDDVYNQKQKFLNMVHLLINCRTILSHHSNFIIGFTRRQANRSVHALA